MITIKSAKLAVSPGGRILDIGCGEGRHTVMAGQNKDTVCVGADLGFENLLAAKNKLDFHRSLNDLSCRSMNLACMDIRRLPFQDKCFDAVICSEVLEHIPDDALALSELTRVLKPGCILAVSVPRFWPEKICWFLSEEYRTADMGHVRIYKKSDLITRIESFGFSHFHTHYAHSIHSPFWWIKCLAGPDRTDSVPVNLYHRFLVWDLMAHPWFSSFLDKLLNPVLGKSMALYFSKKGGK